MSFRRLRMACQRIYFGAILWRMQRIDPKLPRCITDRIYGERR